MIAGECEYLYIALYVVAVVVAVVAAMVQVVVLIDSAHTGGAFSLQQSDGAIGSAMERSSNTRLPRLDTLDEPAVAAPVITMGMSSPQCSSADFCVSNSRKLYFGKRVTVNIYNEYHPYITERQNIAHTRTLHPDSLTLMEQDPFVPHIPPE